ncbi:MULTISPECIES: hypothetical protein [Paenibacillus]|uniref:Hydrolase n=1 Tax=Paenibacillus albilobatus TaxID=2716884 RepID=A0A919XPB9_9BACL|nr:MULTISPECIES: hypothetical protein [Paenibacillus]GIO34455.1 hypothetical protein J2TS6_55960 [Paenibacillus albilobatus]
MDTEKKRYYISVSHHLIQDVPHDSAEFEVMMTEAEMSKLKDKLEDLNQEDENTFKRAFIPFKSADHDEAPQGYNDKLIDVYAYLYEIGDEHTKRTIEGMNILGKMQHTDYNNEGYDDSPFNK